MNKIWSILFVCFLYGCATPTTNENPRFISQLRGEIETEKKSYLVGEDIVVSYTLTNTSEQLHEEPVTNGSKKQGEAFQKYSFNAIQPEDEQKHMDLKDAGKPLSGAISLKPGEKKVFVRNTFVATEPGTYNLKFKLDWRNDKEVSFNDYSVEVKTNVTGSETNPVEEKQNTIDSETLKIINDLVSQDKQTRQIAKEQLIGKGQEGYKALVETMGDENNDLRSAAMLLLIDIGKGAILPLMEGTRHSNKEIRMRSVYSLGQIDPIETIETIRSVLVNDPEKNIRETALTVVLDNYADFVAVPLMIMALEDKDLELRKKIFENLQKRSGEAFGYRPDASEEERKEAIKKWKEWARTKYRGR